MTDAATHIRRLFLEPKETYCIRDAAEILCMPLRDVLGWMEVGELEGVDTPQGVRLSWGEVASFGMGFQPQEAIESALGTDLADAIPGAHPPGRPGSAHPPPRGSWPWNASPAATASRSMPSSRESCWMSYPRTRSTLPRRFRTSQPRFGGRSRPNKAYETKVRPFVSFLSGDDQTGGCFGVLDSPLAVTKTVILMRLRSCLAAGGAAKRCEGPRTWDAMSRAVARGWSAGGKRHTVVVENANDPRFEPA